jgi:uncharacterized protein (TIGR02646 family)
VKHIKKSTPPADYQHWYYTQKALGVNFNYSSFLNPERSNLKEFMVEEQGYLCAYSMKRIGKVDSHIEHVVPQVLCSVGQDVDYLNLLACYPKPNTGKCKFGAHEKDDWWDAILFVSPLHDSCELKFFFNLKGEIYASGNNIAASNETIEKLKLNDPSLTNDRKLAINDFIFGGGGLSLSDVNMVIDSIYQVDASGEFYEYCIAIHDALFEYWDLLKKIT